MRMKFFLKEYFSINFKDIMETVLFISGIVILLLFYFFKNPSREFFGYWDTINLFEMARFGITGIYLSIGLYYWLRRKNITFKPGWIITFSILFRLVVIYPFLFSPQQFIQTTLFKYKEWIGISFLPSIQLAHENAYLIIIGIFLLEIILVYLMYRLKKLYQLNILVLIFYLWNPYIIENLYTYWNPFLIWVLLLFVAGVLLKHQYRLLASLFIWTSILFHDLSLFLIVISIRQLKYWIIVPIGLYAYLMSFPDYLKHTVDKIIYSKWIQTLINIIENENIWLDVPVVFFASIAITTFIWAILSKRSWLEKVYWSFYVFTLVYPPFIFEISIIMLPLAVLYRNGGILALTAYLFLIEAFTFYNMDVFLDSSIYIMYGIIHVFFMLSFFNFNRGLDAQPLDYILRKNKAKQH